MSLQLISRLWSNAREALTRLRASLLPLDTLDRGERRKLNSWIGALEAFVRRIVLIEALNFMERGSSDPPRSRSTKAGRRTRAQTRPRLRLWPRAQRGRARVTLLGPPTSMREIWREQRRNALIARLKAARGRRRRPSVIIADRLDALEAVLAAPMRAARRLARKLTAAPRLAFKLVAARIRSAAGLDDNLLREAQGAAYQRALVFNSS